VTAHGVATVGFLDVMPAVEAGVTTSLAALTEPGGLVTFDIILGNPSSDAVAVVALGDDRLGDLLSADNPAIRGAACNPTPLLLPGETSGCRVTLDLGVDAALGPMAGEIAAVVADVQGNQARALAGYRIETIDAPPRVAVTVAASALAVTPTDDAVTFTLSITNESREALELTEISHGLVGDLLALGGAGGNSCSELPTRLEPRTTVACSFRLILSGAPGSVPRPNTITVVALDNEGGVGTASDSVRVGFAAPGTRLVGQAFRDDDADGVRDGTEPGLAAVPLTVTAPGVGTLTITSDPDGLWSLTVPAGSISVAAPTAADGLSLSTGNALQTVLVVDGAATSLAPMGFAAPGETILGRLTLDLEQDPSGSEGLGVPGVTLALIDGGGTAVAQVVSDGSGWYSFGAVRPGAYTVVISAGTLPAGLVASSDTDGGGDGRVAVIGGDGPGSIVVDFAFRGTQTVANDASSAVSPGAAVTLTWAGFDAAFETADDVIVITVADDAGRYAFHGLPTGLYRLAIA
jgi:hypothetical protein